MSKHNLGDRMKSYEQPYTQMLEPDQYVILRVDGKNFSGMTRAARLRRPFDMNFVKAMDIAADALCTEIQGAQFAYVQSDEISVLITAFNSNAQYWVGGNINKMNSIAAATAAVSFSAHLRIPGRDENSSLRVKAAFDCRTFTVPTHAEAMNYFVWRQQDCHRNAVSMAAEAQYSSKQLMGVGVADRLAMLYDAGIIFEHYPKGVRLGRIVSKEHFIGPVTYTRRDTGEEHTTEVTRSRWVTTDADWMDTYSAHFLDQAIPRRPNDK